MICFSEYVLKKNGVNKNAQIHQLVALAFLLNPHHYTIVNHKDRNPKNNDVNNLEWCTIQYNTTYMDAHIQRGLNVSIGITQLTLDGQFVKNWTSSVEVGRDKRFTQSGVNYCVNCSCNQYRGYVWIKTSAYNTMSPEDIKRYCTIFSFHNNGISVNQITEKPDVIIDFSIPVATFVILEYAKKNNVPVVIATTGFTGEEEKRSNKSMEEHTFSRKRT